MLATGRTPSDFEERLRGSSIESLACPPKLALCVHCIGLGLTQGRPHLRHVLHDHGSWERTRLLILQSGEAKFELFENGVVVGCEIRAELTLFGCRTTCLFLLCDVDNFGGDTLEGHQAWFAASDGETRAADSMGAETRFVSEAETQCRTARKSKWLVGIEDGSRWFLASWAVDCPAIAVSHRAVNRLVNFVALLRVVGFDRCEFDRLFLFRIRDRCRFEFKLAEDEI
jgi:hypothetical protein